MKRLAEYLLISIVYMALILPFAACRDGGGGLSGRLNRANVEQNTLKQCLLCGMSCAAGAEESGGSGEQVRELVNLCLQERCLRALAQDLEARKVSESDTERMMESCRMETLSLKVAQ